MNVVEGFEIQALHA